MINTCGHKSTSGPRAPHIFTVWKQDEDRCVQRSTLSPTMQLAAFVPVALGVFPKRVVFSTICAPGLFRQGACVLRTTFVSIPISSARVVMEDTGASEPTQPDGIQEKRRLDSSIFYGNYSGHPADQLSYILDTRPKQTPVLFLAGDSTLDNKYWLPLRTECHPNPHFCHCLNNVAMSRDVAYWLARMYAPDTFLPINCAVEASTLRQRLTNGLLPQDELIRDQIGPNDVLVVSLGGNDIALSPTISTVFAVLMNVYRGGNAGMSTLAKIFQSGLEQYISQLVSKQKPRLVIVCMVYFPDESSKSPSWASFTLRALRYDSRPDWLQSSIANVFEQAIKKISVDGCQIVFAPLFKALDGKQTDHYVARVEPSELGGNAIAALLKRLIDESFSPHEHGSSGSQTVREKL